MGLFSYVIPAMREPESRPAPANRKFLIAFAPRNDSSYRLEEKMTMSGKISKHAQECSVCLICPVIVLKEKTFTTL
jgi:hypothetical protein